MSNGHDLLVHGGDVYTSEGRALVDILIRGGRIADLGPGLDAQVEADVPRLDASGKLVLPGLVDPQVHFREPGFPHKEDLASGSLSAIAGGVTTFFEMPNTKPPTTSPEAFQDKLQRSRGRVHCDHAYFLGATAENADDLGRWEEEATVGCAGVKIFMGSSTGTLLVPDDPTLERVLRSGHRRVAVHAEDEDRLKENYGKLQADTAVTDHWKVRDVESAVRATTRLLDLVEKTGRKVHVLHISTAEEIAIFRERDLGELVTAEVTPNHLFLEAPGCYEQWGSRAAMNPPVRDKRHQEVIRQALVDGIITCIGSDHAPHTLEEKAKPYPQCPSGIPGVQTILPLMLTAVKDGWLTLDQMVRAVCSGAADTYDLPTKGRIALGMDGDLVLVDPSETGTLQRDWLRSRVGYSPFEGWPLAGYPVVTVLGGRIAYRDHQPVGEPSGKPVDFRARPERVA